MFDVPKRLTLQRPARFVVAAGGAAECFVVLDLLRRGASGTPLLQHLAGSVALYALVGTVCGLAAWGVRSGERVLVGLVPRGWARAGRVGTVLFYAALAAAATWSTAFWTFSGHRASEASYASYGPYVLIGASALAAAVLAWAVPWMLDRFRQGARLVPLSLVLIAVLLALTASWVDLHVLVGLYARLHTALEVATGLLLLLSAYALLSLVDSSRGLRAIRVLAGAGLAWTVVFASLRPVRAWMGAELDHVWLEPVYVGRMLHRAQMAEVLLAHPHDWGNLEARRLDALRQRYGGSTAPDPAWKRRWAEPPAFRDAIRRMRGERHDYNVVVYYVDTLRYDAASDPGIMPHVVGFSRQALDFRNAYSSGSDTLRALPSLTSGSYELGSAHRGNVLDVARRSGRTRVIAIAQSAHEFLGKLDPRFKFDETLVVPDYAQDRTDVWGYGANRSTAKGVVDSALSWLGDHPGKPFFLWLFNFDQHNWRELDKAYVYDVARRYHVPDKAKLNWRYRAVATGIDAQFGRLLDGLKRLGLSDNTIVLFVADHGEGLGRDGFWVHGVFLWQCLLRVPLVLRVPGLSPHAVDDRVSLVDVAPTLARYLVEDPDMSGYQGEDLVGYLVPDRPRRRLPLLMSAVSQQVLVRVGIIEPKGRWKLVLPLDSAVPQLYDLRADDPDAVSVAGAHPDETRRLLGRLVRSPIYPRPGTAQGKPTLAGAR